MPPQRRITVYPFKYDDLTSRDHSDPRLTHPPNHNDYRFHMTMPGQIEVERAKFQRDLQAWLARLTDLRLTRRGHRPLRRHPYWPRHRRVVVSDSSSGSGSGKRSSERIREDDTASTETEHGDASRMMDQLVQDDDTSLTEGERDGTDSEGLGVEDSMYDGDVEDGAESDGEDTEEGDAYKKKEDEEEEVISTGDIDSDYELTDAEVEECIRLDGMARSRIASTRELARSHEQYVVGLWYMF
ncbi:MAG: hypothetical protein Q9164_005916 [Protoblastenia rupestris]